MAFLVAIEQGKTVKIDGPLQLSIKGAVVPTVAATMATKEEEADDDETTRGREAPYAHEARRTTHQGRR